MHAFVEQIERLLMALLLFGVGAFVAPGGLAPLTWRGAATGVPPHLLMRPATGRLTQLRGPGRPNERAATASLGIRGIGSLSYRAYAGWEDLSSVRGQPLRRPSAPASADRPGSRSPRRPGPR